MKKAAAEAKKRGRPPGPVTRTFPLGDFTISISGPKDAILKFESRHNYAQFAIDDGELREKVVAAEAHLPAMPDEFRELARTVREIAAREPSSEIPGEGPGHDHVLSDIGLKSSGIPEIDARQHIKAVTDSIPGAF